MLSACGPLVRAQQPSLDQGRDAVHCGHACVGGISTSGNNGSVVRIAMGTQGVVASPPVCPDLGTRLGNGANKGDQALFGYIRDSLHANSTKSLGRMEFDGNGHNGLVFAAPTSFPALVTAPEIGFIHFDAARKLVAVGANHGRAKLMQAGPCGLVALNSQRALQAESAGSVFLAGHEPGNGKPRSQWHPGSMENGSGGHGDFVLAFPAMQIASGGCPWLFCRCASAANKSIGPPAFSEVEAAGLLAIKPIKELLVCFRIIDTRNWMGVLHAWNLYVGGTCVNLIPRK